MMNQPPIDELTKKTSNKKFKLSCLTAKRAKELEQRLAAEIQTSEKKAISLALEEIYNGVVVSSDEVNS